MSAPPAERTWKTVWDARRLDPSRGSTLAQLMAADGLDTGFGSVAEDAWRRQVQRIAGRLGIGPGTSVFDVGCGAGAFLYELDRMGCRVGGLDQSAVLVSWAREVMPRGSFLVADAAELDPADRWDVVVSASAFLYFPSLPYAEGVLETMARKAKLAVAVLDLPDASRKEAALAMRRGTLGEAEYEERYRGLDHLYVERSWMASALTRCGLGDVAVEDQLLEGYANGAHRFNAFGFHAR